MGSSDAQERGATYRFIAPHSETLYIGDIKKIVDTTKGLTFFAKITDLSHDSNFADPKWDTRPFSEDFYGLGEDVFIAVDAVPLGFVDAGGNASTGPPPRGGGNTVFNITNAAAKLSGARVSGFVLRDGRPVSRAISAEGLRLEPGEHALPYRSRAWASPKREGRPSRFFVVGRMRALIGWPPP